MLEDYARRNGFPNPTHFTDDGISGTRFDRPGFIAMMEEVEAGRVEAIIIKDSCVIIDLNQKDPKMLGLSGLVYSFLTEKRTIKTTVVIQMGHRPLYGGRGGENRAPMERK